MRTQTNAPSSKIFAAPTWQGHVIKACTVRHKSNNFSGRCEKQYKAQRKHRLNAHKVHILLLPHTHTHTQFNHKMSGHTFMCVFIASPLSCSVVVTQVLQGCICIALFRCESYGTESSAHWEQRKVDYAKF